MNLRVINGVFLCLLGPAVAPAQEVLSYVSNIMMSSENWPATQKLPKFDPNLGTLTDVTISYNATITQSIFGENKGQANSWYDFSSTANLGLTRQGGGVLLPLTSTSLHQGGMLAAFDGKLDYAGLSGITVRQTTPLHGQFDDHNLAAYIGRGAVVFDGNAGICSSALLTGCDGITGVTDVTGVFLTIQYTYTPIPEPAGAAALLAVIALGFALRRSVTTA